MTTTALPVASGSGRPPFPLPAQDRELSPFTGWTRAHWEATADGLLRAAWRWATPGCALLGLPGPPSGSGVRSDGLEGYARTFLAAAFRVAGAGGADPHGWLDRYAAGLAAGTAAPGRDDTESWPLVLGHDVAGQPMVESASVALGLRLTRPWLWDRLGADVQDRTEAWLRGALRHVPAPNNWYLFPYTVAGFLESVGRGDDETARARARALELLDGWYVGDGWYSDGDGRAFDHYNGWALHLYPVLDALLGGGTGPADAADRHGGRLAAHLESFGLFFGGDGAPLHYGRSTTYRFAAGAAVALGAVTGHTPLSPGTSRRVASGALRYFLDRGACSPDGLLTLGWHGPHPASVQHYSGPASPYWASKAFVALLAGDGHPLWTATEEAAPSEGPDRVAALPGPGLLVHSTRADGIVRLHNHGTDHVRPHEGETGIADDPMYDRAAYSTHTGPTSAANVPDNHLWLEVAGVPSRRRRIRPLGAGQGDGWGWAASWHRPVFPQGPPMVPGLRVESVTVVHGHLELRVHRVLGAPGGAVLRQTGWATGPDGPLESALHPLHGWDVPEGTAGAEGTADGAAGTGGTADSTHGTGTVRAPQGTAFTRWALVPQLTACDAGGSRVYAALAVLTADGAPRLAEAVGSVHVDGDVCTVRWSGDSGVTTVGFAPLTVTHEPGPQQPGA